MKKFVIDFLDIGCAGITCNCGTILLLIVGKIERCPKCHRQFKMSQHTAITERRIKHGR